MTPDTASKIASAKPAVLALVEQGAKAWHATHPPRQVTVQAGARGLAPIDVYSDTFIEGLVELRQDGKRLFLSEHAAGKLAAALAKIVPAA